jgi:hypothetical protein
MDAGPGDNRLETIDASGVAGAEAGAGSGARHDQRRLRNMWLSHGDVVRLMERALLANASGWPAPGIVINGMSANRGMPWDTTATRALIGYEAR